VLREVSLPLLARSWIALVVLALAAPARADWHESGEVQITIATPGIVHVEAEEVEPGADVVAVLVGDEPDPGELTVLAEGNITERQDLGSWNVNLGQGNIHSTWGEGFFRVGSGINAGDTEGVLEILGSDVVGGVRVEKGTLRVIAGSKVDSLHIFPLGNAYVSMGSRTKTITAREGSYLSIDASIVEQLAVQTCELRGTALIVDSSFSCGNLETNSGADTDVYPSLTPFSAFHIEQNLRMIGAILDVESTDASTGSIDLFGVPDHETSLDIAATRWTNAGDIFFGDLNDGGQVELLIHGGSDFVQEGTITLYHGTLGDGLVVTGGGTTLEVGEDVLVGSSPPTAQVAGTMTVGAGAVVTVHGTLRLGPSGVLNLEEGGTIYANAAELLGTVVENGGELVVPEADAIASAGAALGSLAARAMRGRARRSSW
jgi:hypothetical protein